MLRVRFLVICVIALGVQTAIALTETVDGITWTYTVANDVASVGHEAHYYTAISTSTSGAIVIPAILGGKPVTCIGAYAFWNCSNLTDVTIPNSVTNIGMHAFHNCTQLTSIAIPEMVSEIGMCAFCGCTGLVTANIPDKITNIESMMFYHCQKLTNVIIPNGVTNIGDSAFDGCSGLTNVTFQNSVRRIGHQAFHGCSKLDKVVILGVDAIVDDLAFAYCSSLADVKIGNGVTKIGGKVFSGCSKLTNITINNGVTDIGASAFFGCRGLTSVVIPDSVTHIGIDAFSGCSRLANVIIGEGVTDIGASAFFGCSGLQSIYVASGNTAYKVIDGLLLSKDGHLLVAGVNVNGDVVIPDSVTTIESSAFSDRDDLRSVTIPNSVTNIGDWVFGGCSGLTSVTIPSSVTSIGDYAFCECSGLASVTFDGNAPTIGSLAFDRAALGCCAYVHSASTGWNVDIPGTWNGLAIDYLHHNVTFNACGGEYELTSTNIVDGITIGELPVPTHTNAAFLGWFTAAEEGSMIDGSTIITEAMTLYAHWWLLDEAFWLLLDEALDVCNKVAVTTSASFPWMPILDSGVKVGDTTARSYAIGDRTNTWLSATVEGAGTMSFWYKVSCEHDEDNTFTWDRLMVYTNDVEIVEWRIDGETDWTQRSLSFDGGTNVVKWVYFKDRSVSEGEDCAWVDGLVWTPSGPVDTVVSIGGKEVTVAKTWLEAHENIVRESGGGVAVALQSTAANGRLSNVECYVLGLDPEDATNDFKIVSFPMKADGTPDIDNIVFDPPQAKWNVPAMYKVMGAADLGGPWVEVPDGGGASEGCALTLRFFKVVVELP